jgi:two-component system response regulator YesN
MYRILLVDDEVFARQGLRNLIDWASCGFEVIGEAGNGEDALAFIQQHKPELVITDIRMPVLDGMELIRHTIEDQSSKTSFIIISGFDDFKYAQQAVRFGVHDFILKPIDKEVLETTLIQLHRKLIIDKSVNYDRELLLHNKIITSLIKGEMDAETLVENANLLGIAPNNKVIYTFVEINDNHPWKSKTKSLTQEMINDVIRQAIHNTVHIHRTMYLHEHRNRIGFVLSIEDLSEIQYNLSKFASQLQNQISEKLEYTVYVYMGSAVSGILELSNAYQTAKDALQYKFLKKDCMYVIYDDVKHLTLNDLDMDNHIYEQLTLHIEEYNEKAVHETIDRIFQEFQEKKFAPEAVKLTINRCVSDIIKTTHQMGIDKQELTMLEPISSWQDLNLSFQELKRLFTQFVIHTAQILSTVRKENMKGSIQKIKTYIEANYHENINLKSLATEFYMNPVYLGQLFKKTYGMYFNEYLLQIRVSEAKKLLRQTDMRSYEVAEKVGFSNADYFVTQFEKIEHVTPTEYRNKLL